MASLGPKFGIHLMICTLILRGGTGREGFEQGVEVPKAVIRVWCDIKLKCEIEKLK